MEKISFELPPLFCGKLHKDPSSFLKDEFWFIFNDSKLLVDSISLQPAQLKNISLERSIYLGTFEKSHFYAGEISIHTHAPQGTVWIDLRSLYEKISGPIFALAGRASQLILWDRTHQFCGQCGTKTITMPKEQARKCPHCQLLSFPKICPAIMALILKDDEILLARGEHFPPNMYSVLAGFVDAGENLEQCVRREVFEEVGLEIDKIEYFGSQSWPFPQSLMVAFTCQWRSGEIKIDPNEIADARWFKKDDLPLLPSKMGLSRHIIDSVL